MTHFNFISSEKNIGFKIVDSLIDNVLLDVRRGSWSTMLSSQWKQSHISDGLFITFDLGVICLEKTKIRTLFKTHPK